MAEVTDFSAIRISLASPEQIRSWSHGEVTKPETINYRTLKPEFGGLFCERIFGPTKDWECYCGKYKRVRYKGVVCEKCGVEVTRSKVRRERMGHIELAAPVAHIWYVKGTPSRLGLLLDISPRNLERVLYFASYIVTEVDEKARNDLIQKMENEANRRIEHLEAEVSQKEAEALKEVLPAIEEKKRNMEAVVADLERQMAEKTESAISEAQQLEATLISMKGTAARTDIFFSATGAVIVQAGEAVNEDRITRLREELQRFLVDLEENTRASIEAARALFESEREFLETQIRERFSGDRAAFEAAKAKVIEELQEKLEKVRSVHRLQLLSETQYRELQEVCGKIFRAGMGAEAIREIVSRIDLDEMALRLREEAQSTSGQRRKKAIKRLRVVEAFRKSGNRPEWMLLTVLPVLPPDLRPMVQLDGGRFATSDLNDLYRRVINRNNRLKKLQDLSAPEIIIRNEKRMLQEAVDALIDNGRRGRVVAGAGKHKLKSLSDMLKGKQGRFRQNLLGKRVDYSGRSVIVVGPELKLHQCGLPKKMALELFKPFVMRKLIEKGYATNIRSAKKKVERVDPEVWDVLEEVIKHYLVLLNRAPTLHRLGIQAFEAVLVEGSAIQLHPLVCTAYNADFDGDQMAVHLPLSRKAQQEARERMISVRNLLSPSNGEPIVSPTQDIVLGAYYMTVVRPGARGEGKIFSSPDEAMLAYHLGHIDLQAPIKVHVELNGQRKLIDTTAGKLIFCDSLPPELRSHERLTSRVMDKKALKELMAEAYRLFGPERAAQVADEVKRVGFHYATKSGLSIAVSDLEIPAVREEILRNADQRVETVERQYRRGYITDEERYRETVEIWTQATEEVTRSVEQSLNRFGALYMMANSGAKGNIQQIRQMAGMRGLMADPAGRIIDLPIRSNFREGLTVLEYFISTHGARKGLADTALRTADSGYLTRRLVDVAQDVIVTVDDCGTASGIWMSASDAGEMAEPLRNRIQGRVAAADVVDPKTGRVLVRRNEEIDDLRAKEIVEAGIDRIRVRSPMACEARYGVCRMCYGRNLAVAQMVDLGEAVGIIAAQSIGEPGTQLTMRTFHTGGVAAEDITQGLPRVEELFEARVPKGKAVMSLTDGVVDVRREGDSYKITVTSTSVAEDDYELPSHFELLVRDGDTVRKGEVLARSSLTDDEAEIVAQMDGIVSIEPGRIVVRVEDTDEHVYQVPATARLRVETGDRVPAGYQLTEGSLDPHDILQVLGKEAVQRYLVDEVQKVYRSQGVNTNDKHIEIIVRQMLRKVVVDEPGDTDLLPGELMDRFNFEEVNARVLAQGGKPATARLELLGITKAALKTESFLSAASFQETTRVLTEAAVNGAVDYLRGLKENVIIGKLIPAGSGFLARLEAKRRREMAGSLATGEGGTAAAGS
jgi:DNA-directed RNA polymerase subunit beta'